MVTILVSLSRGSLFLLVLRCSAWSQGWGAAALLQADPEHLVWWSGEDVVVLT